MANNRLKNISTPELIDELIKREEIVKLKAGVYREWELLPKYKYRTAILPKDYEIFIKKRLLHNLQKQIEQHQ